MESLARLLDVFSHEMSYLAAVGASSALTLIAVWRVSKQERATASGIVGKQHTLPAKRRDPQMQNLPLDREFRLVRPLPGTVGPVSARAAFGAIRHFLEDTDPAFRLTFITAGDGLDHTGLSFYWDVFVELPTRDARAVCSLQPAAEEGGIEERELRVIFSFSPDIPRAADGGLLSALPQEFVDSTRAIAALKDQGADFICGDRNMTLATRVLRNGESVWFTRSFGHELRSPFDETSKSAGRMNKSPMSAALNETQARNPKTLST